MFLFNAFFQVVPTIYEIGHTRLVLGTVALLAEGVLRIIFLIGAAQSDGNIVVQRCFLPATARVFCYGHFAHMAAVSLLLQNFVQVASGKGVLLLFLSSPDLHVTGFAFPCYAQARHSKGKLKSWYGPSFSHVLQTNVVAPSNAYSIALRMDMRFSL